jgi:hypothetical protein
LRKKKTNGDGFRERRLNIVGQVLLDKELDREASFIGKDSLKDK